MTDYDKLEERRQMARSNYYAQLAMMGYGSDGNALDLVKVVRCRDCKHSIENAKHAEQFVKDRNAAFMAFVLNDDWEPVKKYCINYGISMPDNLDVMAAGIYKAVQECIDIPDDVKVKAAMKCMKLGFTPFMRPIE